MTDFLQGFKEFVIGIFDFIDALVELISFLWDMIFQLDDLISMVSSAAANIPKIFTILPSCLYTFATSIIIVTVLYLILGRNN